MSNQLHGYNPSYGGAGDTSLRGSTSSKYLSAAADSLSSSSTALSSSMLYNPDSYSIKIPAISSTSHSYGPPGVDAGSTVTSTDSIYASLKRSASEALYHQTLLGVHNTIGQTEAWYTANPLAKRYKYESTSHLLIYPQRPGERDCAFYMQTRTCKFGESCKFDHPIWVPEGGIQDWKEVPPVLSESLPERPGEPDCPYFLKTQRCKFGIRCRFNHPQDSIALPGAPEDGDVSALPERPSEPLCAFYMKTGICKFGTTCKFHHPKDVQIQSAGEDDNGAQNTGFVDSKLLLPSFAPALLHNTKGLPVRPGEEDCPFYLKTGSCKYGTTCRYNHPERNAINLPATVVAPTLLTSPSTQFNNYGVLAPAASLMSSYATLGYGVTIYPQRPGQPECDFYMKTGICKFADTCKFHHPFDRSAPTAANESLLQSVKLTLAGLPRREGSVHCPYYMKTGTCKYGATCKFDHPPPGEVMAMTTDSSVVAGEEKEDGEEDV